MNPLPEERNAPGVSTAEDLKHDPERPSGGHDPRHEERSANGAEQIKEKTLDKTLADSFPTSDPPSSIPNPSCDEDGDCEDEAA